ncbi:MAG: ankyrin repeat domain-containing protein [Planctomycetota bacterium]|nr:ankyrin repeat domain-containing protein [Planctomycetota bacterium]
MLSLGIGVGDLVFQKSTPAPTLRPAYESTQELRSVWDLDVDIRGSQVDYIRMLISEGADVHAKNNDGQTPRMRAAGDSNSPEMVTLLIEAGADVNAKYAKDWTPLMDAAIRPSTPEIVTLLIEAGADVHAKNHEGSTPLRYATNPEIIKIL